jgi:Contractile injection system tape measure protein
MVHRIRTLRWRASTRSAEQAFAARQCLRDLWPSVLKDVFEQEFDRFASEDRIVRIPKIELRVKVRSEQELAEVLPGLVLRYLQEYLNPITRAQSGFKPQNIAWRKSTRQENEFETLLHYLHTGSAHWSTTPVRVQTDLHESLWEQREAIITYLNSANESFVFYFRLLELLSSEEQVSVVASLARKFPRKRTQFIILLLNRGREYFSRYTQLKLAAAFIQFAVEAKESSIETVEVLLEPPEKQRFADFLSLLPSTAQELFRPAQRAAVNESSRKSAHSQASHLKLENAAEREQTEDKFPLAVNCAGMILMHPFIVGFFENVAVLAQTKNESLLPKTLARAAASLHFVATGREEVHEWELGFIKLLLGLNPESPLPISEGLLTSEDKEQADLLLRSVIGHWSALRNTSVQGLQSSFLQRQGLLREEEDNWTLHVESKSFDVLLNHLPWSISVVKLPWMKKAIYTEWRPL